MPLRLLSLVLRPTPAPWALGLVVAACFIAAETLALYPLERFAPRDSLSVVYLLGVLVVSVGWGLWLAVVTSVASALVFDFFHVLPAFEFTPAQPEDLVALIIFLVVALLTSALANLARSRAAAADRAAERARVLAEQHAALRRVATLVAREVGPAKVFAAVTEEMAGCLNVENSSILRYEGEDQAVVVAAHSRTATAQTPRIGQRLAVGAGNIAATVLRTGRTARVDSFEDAADSTAALMRELNLRSAVGAPIVVDGKVWGLAVVSSSLPEPLPPNTEQRVSDFADLAATSNARRSELLASRARVVAAADDARRRLERDLHDGAQQQLITLGLKVQLAEDLVLPEQEELREQLSDMAADLTGVSRNLREISRGIHPAILSEGGLGPALKALGRRSTVPVSFDVTLERRLPDYVEIAAYYVVAEALTNTAKHAKASRANVRAETTDATLDLSIQDDGIGGADFRKGSGLIGLKDRVEAAGGQIRLTSPPGSGTLLHITIPLESH